MGSRGLLSMIVVGVVSFAHPLVFAAGDTDAREHEMVSYDLRVVRSPFINIMASKLRRFEQQQNINSTIERQAMLLTMTAFLGVTGSAIRHAVWNVTDRKLVDSEESTWWSRNYFNFKELCKAQNQPAAFAHAKQFAEQLWWHQIYAVAAHELDDLESSSIPAASAREMAFSFALTAIVKQMAMNNTDDLARLYRATLAMMKDDASTIDGRIDIN